MSTSSIGRSSYDEHECSIEDLCRRLKTDRSTGLSWEEARRRLGKYGPNILQPPKKTLEIVRFMKTLFHGFSSLLWFGAILSLFVFFFDGWQKSHVNYDNLGLAGALILVVFLAGLFSFYQEGKSDKVMQSFMSLIPDEAQVIRNGTASRVLANKLVVGDILVIDSGDKIAADVRIIHSDSLKTDHSCLTGESDPLLRSHRLTSHDPMATDNLAFSGTFAVEGQGQGIVIRTGGNTLMGYIARLTSEIKEPPTTFAKEISHFIMYLVIWACCLGITLSSIMLLVGYQWQQALIFFVGIIIANVPEGLMPTLTLSLTLASQRMAARNCLVKKLEVVESFGTTSIVCSDKTGTLTQNRMTVSHLMFNKHLFGVRLIGTEKKCLAALARCAAICSRAEFVAIGNRAISITKRAVKGDASESAILKCPEIATEKETQQWRKMYPKVFERPFNSYDKHQLSVHSTSTSEKDGKYLLVMKGAPERIMAICSSMLLEKGEVPMTVDWLTKITNACSLLAGSGERVLAFCDYEDFPFNESDFKAPKEGLRFLGLIAMIDPPRPNVPDAVLQCRDAGIKVIMVTGDHHLTAMAIAKQVHILSRDSAVQQGFRDYTGGEEGAGSSSAIVIRGEELDAVSNEVLDRVVLDYAEIVFARTTPKQKLRIVESCQRVGGVVAVTGDGVNDAPALKRADIGIAMGVSGSAVAIQSAKLVLLDDNFATLVSGIEEGRLVFENLKKSIGYTLTHMSPEVILLLIHVFAGMPLPMSVIVMLCIDIGTDMWPSIALAYEPPESDLMKQKPRNVKKDRIVNVALLFQILKMGILETLAGLLAYFIVMAESGWHPQDLLGTTGAWTDEEKLLTDTHGIPWLHADRKALEQTCYTAAFVAVVETQVINALIFKRTISTNFSKRTVNPHLAVAITFSLLLTLSFIYVPGVSMILQLQSLPARWWLPAVPFAAVMLAYDEIRKKIARDNPKGWLHRNTVH